jgi:acetoin utilization deacetylase AcuC-like enzyme
MKILFHEKFYESDYADNGSSAPGRMEAIMESIHRETTYVVVQPAAASEKDILLAHTQSYIDTIRPDRKLFDMAMLAAGAAIMAADTGFNEEPAFACIRPPGHHASRDSAWGYCIFSNMAVALLHLKHQGKISSAFILDFDAHTGDGTKSILSYWKECKILNPYADSREEYIKEIQTVISQIKEVDIVAVCAGFDSYKKDAGRKLATFDFYTIGTLMKQLSHKAASNKRFAILEGGYYQPDLGKNVTAFCQGFE